MSGCAAEKRRVRRELLAIRRSLPEETRRERDAAIAAHVLQSTLWQQADTVFLYIGTDWEIDTRPLLAAAFAAGRRVAVPLCGKGGVMTAREIRSLQELSPGAYGIPEPAGDAPILPPEQIDLAVVPAVAYDREGYRLGRGGGYYDRFLPRVGGKTLGLCYENLILSTLPREAHDCRVETIITEEGEKLWV